MTWVLLVGWVIGSSAVGAVAGVHRLDRVGHLLLGLGGDVGVDVGRGPDRGVAGPRGGELEVHAALDEV